VHLPDRSQESMMELIKMVPLALIIDETSLV
jgi:hypothetical protein